MAWVPPLIGLAGDLFGASSASKAQKKANEMNLQISREQRAWEENMANTAVSRRADDFERAGFNRLLAATGVGAATPSVSPPTMEPTFRSEWTKGATSQAVLLAEQLRNMRANTVNTAEEARQKKIINDDMERKGPGGINMYSWRKDTKALREAVEYDIAGIRKDMTSSQLKQLNEQMPFILKNLQQQAEKGKLDLDQIKSVVETLGLGAEQKANILQKLTNIVMQMMTAKE